MHKFFIGAVIVWAMLLLRAAYAAEPLTHAPNSTIPPVQAPIPSGLCTTFRWQYGAESAQQAAALLGYPCHHNWIADSYGVAGHTPTAYSLQPSHLAGYVADANDGEFWLVGSEPNIGATRIEPSDAAIFAGGWVTQTNVPWACCGTLQHHAYAYLLDWLDDYLAAGGEIPDAWSIHIYFVDAGGWDATLTQFNAWMVANDVVRPVLVTETGQTNDVDAAPLLKHVAEAVCDGDVRAVYWYIGDKDAYNFAPRSQLTIDGEITPLGELFVTLQTCAQEQPTATPTEPPAVRVWLPLAWR